MRARGVLRTIEGDHVGFFCPGCQEMHVVRVPPAAHAWGFNGNYDAPTFTPSILVTGTVPITEDEAVRIMRGETVEPKPMRCHSFVTDGKIQFLADCTHALGGQTVPLEALQ